MCGISAYAGKDQALPFIYEALKRLEYRGYDSWGVLSHDGATPFIFKSMGPPSKSKLPTHSSGRLGIGHTRWATNGKPSLENTHPIAGYPPIKSKPTCWVVHNGVIANHKNLRHDLEFFNYTFNTETDTEVIAHLLEYCSFFDSPRLALQYVTNHLRGDFAFAAISEAFPGYLMVYSHGAPLVCTEGGHLASDPAGLPFGMAYTRIPKGVLVLKHIDGLWEGLENTSQEHAVSVGRPIDDFPARPSGGEEDTPSMLKEILEQPTILRDFYLEWNWPQPTSWVLFGCGSSWHAALLGAHYLETLTQVRADAYYASEFQHKPKEVFHSCRFVALTQSGETKDTLSAMESIPRDGPLPSLVTITNNESSTAAHISPLIIPLRVGEERGVAATKTFTAQVAALLSMAICGHSRESDIRFAITYSLPNAMEQLLARKGDIEQIADTVSTFDHILYLATGPSFPIALEGALKMKEVAYIHAEGLPAAEMKHGPLALIDEKTLCIFLMYEPNDKIFANIEEVKSRSGECIIICGPDVELVGENVLILPKVSNIVSPLLENLALQLLAYYVATKKGLNVDYPRSLAKCITV